MHRGRRPLSLLLTLATTFAVVLGLALPAGASNHLSPTPGSGPSLAWLNQVPLAALDQAAADTELTLVVTAGSAKPVIDNVGFGTPATIDADRDGNDDLQATLTVDTSVSPPRARLLVDKLLASNDPTDVEMLALVPWGGQTDEPSDARHNLVVGFRTVGGSASSGFTTGGTLPGQVILDLQMTPLSGLAHDVTLGITTENAANPVRLLTGYLDGNDTAGVVDAHLVSTLPHEPVPRIDISLSVDAADLNSTPERGKATLDWSASGPVPVTFDFLESETTPRATPDVDTHVLGEEMPESASLALTLQDGGDDMGRTAVLDWTSEYPMTLLEVHHHRHNSDGPTEIDARVRNLETQATIGLHDDGRITLTLPSGGQVTLEVEATLADVGASGGADGRAWFGLGQFTHELDHVVARIERVGEATLTPRFGADAGVALDVTGGSFFPPDLRFLATDDLSSPRLPQEWSAGSYPVSGHPETWPTLSRRDAEVGVVDDHRAGSAGSSIAARFGGINALDVTTTPANLGEAVRITPANPTDLDADVFLSAEAPMASGTRTDATCELSLPAGPSQIDVQQPGHYGFNLAGPMPALDCDATRGQIAYDLAATDVPALTSVDVPDFGDDGDGSLQVRARDRTESEVGIAIGSLELHVRDEVDGLTTTADLLHDPVMFAALRAQELPSTDATWSTVGSQTSVDIAAITENAPENLIGALDLRVRTDRPQEALSGIPSPTLGGTTHHDSHYLQAVEQTTSVWLGGGVRDAKSMQAQATDGGTATSLSGKFAGPHPAAVELRTTDGGPFTSGWSLDLTCAVGPVPTGTSDATPPATFTVVPPDQQISVEGPGAFGDLGCTDVSGSGPGEVRRASDGLAADLSADGASLPSSMTVDLDPNTQVALDTAGSQIGFVRVALEDASGSGLPNSSGMFDDPLHAATVRLDDARSSTTSWDATGGTSVTIAPAGSSSRLGSAQIEVRTTGAPSSLGDVTSSSPHLLEVFERAPDDGPYDGRLRARLVDVTDGSVDLQEDPRNLHVELGTGAARPMQLSLDTGFGGEILPQYALDLTGEIVDVPSAITLDSDLTGHHEVTASSPISAVRLRGTVWDDPDLKPLSTQQRADQEKGIRVNVEIADLPISNVVVDVPTLSVTMGGTVGSGTIGSIDAQLVDPRKAGLFADQGISGLHRARVTLEDVPDDVSIDDSQLTAPTDAVYGSDGPTRVLSGTARLSNGSGSAGPVGRVAVELESHGDGLNGMPYTFLRVDLEDVPTTWTAEFTVDVAGPEVTVEAPNGQLGEALVELTKDDRGPARVSDELDRFAGASSSLFNRTSYVENIDSMAYGGTAIPQRLDDLYDDPVALSTTTSQRRPAPWPDPGAAAPGQRTVATQDHAVVRQGGGGGLQTVSARISDLRRVTVPIGDTSRSMTVERANAGTDPFFVGLSTKEAVDFDQPDELGTSSRGSDDPKAKDDTVAYDRAQDSGAKGYKVLGNDEPASDQDGDALDATTLAIDTSPSHGTATVTDGRIEYEPNGGFLGWDQLVYHVCDADGDCNDALLKIFVSEYYDELTMVDVDDLPDTLTFSFDGTFVDEDGEKTWKLRDATYSASAPIGRVDILQGPQSALEHARPRMLRGIVYDAPDSGTLHLEKIGFPSQLNLDLSDTADAIFGFEDGDTRSVLGVKGEDAGLDIGWDGWLLNTGNEKIILEHIWKIGGNDHPHPNRPRPDNPGCQFDHFGFCDRMLFVGGDLDTVGDATGARASGFFATYQRKNPVDSGSDQFLPRWTTRFTGVRGGTVGAELQLRPLRPYAVIPFLNVKAGAQIGGSFDLDYWDHGKRMCFNVPSLIEGQVQRIGNNHQALTYNNGRACVEFGQPSYVTGIPWNILPWGLGLSFDPYSGSAPPQPSGSGIASFADAFVDPLDRFAVVALNPVEELLRRLGDAARTRAQSAEGEVHVTEIDPASVDSPIAGRRQLAVRLEGDEATMAAGVQVALRAERLGSSETSLCAVLVRPDGSAGTSRCLSPEQLHEPGNGGTLRLTVADPGTVVVVERTGGGDAAALRAAGATRIQTAVEAARNGWWDAPTVLLATSQAFPDALSAAPLAGALDAPILLTPTDSLADEVSRTLTHLDTERVVILGGEQAVSANVADQLHDQGLTVDRIGGGDRIETAELLAATAHDEEPAESSLGFVASAAEFPDALSASPIAAARHLPLYLTTPNGLADSTAEAMTKAGVEEVFIVGGPAAIDAAVVDDLRSAGIDVRGRLAGGTRYETARAVADWAIASGSNLDEVLLATGENFPDSLTGGALAGRAGRVLLLAHPLLGGDQPAGAFLAHHADDVDRLLTIGGPVAVPVAVEDAMQTRASGG